MIECILCSVSACASKGTLLCPHQLALVPGHFLAVLSVILLNSHKMLIIALLGQKLCILVQVRQTLGNSAATFVAWLGTQSSFFASFCMSSYCLQFCVPYQLYRERDCHGSSRNINCLGSSFYTDIYHAYSAAHAVYSNILCSCLVLTRDLLDNSMSTCVMHVSVQCQAVCTLQGTGCT